MYDTALDEICIIQEQSKVFYIGMKSLKYKLEVCNFIGEYTIQHTLGLTSLGTISAGSWGWIVKYTQLE